MGSRSGCYKCDVTARRPIRLAVLDDGLFVRTSADTIHPVSATFHRFVEAVVGAGKAVSIVRATWYLCAS